MTTVFCTHFKREMPALEKAPMPGEMGEIILKHVSAHAWHEWLEAQIKIINEERLDLSEERAQQRLFQQMIAYLNLGDFVDANI